MKVGDRVEIGEGTERDTGEVVEVVSGPGSNVGGETIVRVRWDLAREIYVETSSSLRLLAVLLLALLGACGDNLSRPDGGGDAIMSVDASPPVPDAGCTAALCVGADAGACAIVCDVAGPAPSGWGCNARGECSCAPGGTPACTP